MKISSFRKEPQPDQLGFFVFIRDLLHIRPSSIWL